MAQDLATTEHATIVSFNDAAQKSILSLFMPTMVSILLLLELIRFFTNIKL